MWHPLYATIGEKLGRLKKVREFFENMDPTLILLQLKLVKSEHFEAFREVEFQNFLQAVTKIYFKTSEIRAFESISDGQISKFSSRKIFFIGGTQGKCVTTMIEASVVWTPILPKSG